MWLSELIWRDFYCMILYHHPRVVSHAFRPELDAIAFPNDETRFRAWCEARTGYPLVDAAMRQINQTGYMHNRLRMVDGLFPGEGSARGLALGRALLRAAPERLRSRREQRWLAMGCVDGLRRAAILPNLQSGDAVAAVRSTGSDSSASTCPSSRDVPDRHIHAPWLMSDEEQAQSGVVIGRDYPRTHRGSRAGAQGDVGALRKGRDSSDWKRT